jgi:hypothetical protein
MELYKAIDFVCTNCNLNDGQVLRQGIYSHIICKGCRYGEYFEDEHCCAQPKYVMIQLGIKNGNRMQREACVNCKNVNSVIYKKQSNFNALPYLTYENHLINKDKKQAERHSFYEEVKKYKENIKALNKQSWDKYYKEVLQSSEWKIKRKKVIKRCNNICEGCGEKPVQEVHHLTYDRLGQEFLFQLIGLCKNCHSKIHSS